MIALGQQVGDCRSGIAVRLALMGGAWKLNVAGLLMHVSRELAAR